MKQKQQAFIFTLLFAAQTALLYAEPPSGLSLQNLSVPEGLGKIEDRYEGNTERWVIQIQDVHAHFLAQENIAAIVDHINRNYGIDVIALEGGWSETSLPRSWELPSSREKQMVGRALLEEAHIGGPVFAALFSKTPMHIVGIEDPAFYEENLQTYRGHLRERDAAAAQLERADKELSARKSKIYNPELLRFDYELMRFHEGHKAEEFLPSLVGRARHLQIEFVDLPQVTLFQSILRKEDSLHKEKLEDEARRLMQSFKNTRLTFEELLRSGKISEEKIEFYPETKKYRELMKLEDQLRHHEFFAEIETLIERTKKKLIATEEERRLVEQWEQFELLRSIILFQATPENLRAYQDSEQELKDEARGWGLNAHLDLALEFYNVAKKRDEIFFEKIKTDARLSGNIIIVTGGFHTDGLSELLRQSNVSYITIRPDLGKDSPDEELYYKRLTDSVPKIETLSHEQNRYAFLDSNFTAGVQELQRSNNLFKAVERATRLESPASDTQSPVASIDGLRLQDFAAMEPQARLAEAGKLFRAAKEGKLPISLVLRSSVLASLLQEEAAGRAEARPVGLKIWEEIIAPDRDNVVVVIQDSDEIMDATIGVAAKIIRVMDEKMTVEDVIQSRLRNAKSIAVIDAEYLKEDTARQILVLPPSPASLLLARPMLESGTFTTPSEEFINALSAELLNFFETRELLEEAA